MAPQHEYLLDYYQIIMMWCFGAQHNRKHVWRRLRYAQGWVGCIVTAGKQSMLRHAWRTAHWRCLLPCRCSSYRHVAFGEHREWSAVALLQGTACCMAGWFPYRRQRCAATGYSICQLDFDSCEGTTKDARLQDYGFGSMNLGLRSKMVRTVGLTIAALPPSGIV